jgi:septal ring-binding cell division protein DamX
MTGYVRQSALQIVTGQDITAAPLDAEFNKLRDAMDVTGGHTHDGSSVGEGPKINLSTSIVGFLPATHGGSGGKNNFSATTVPGASDDTTQGYAVGSLWYNTSSTLLYICSDSTGSAAVWKQISLQSASGIQSNVDIDSGTIDGTTIGGNTPAAGTFTTLNTGAGNTATLPFVDINGGTIDNTVIGNAVALAITGTTITANTNFVGDIVGDVTGNVTASTGTSTFNNVTVDGQLNMNAATGTTNTIINLTAPVNPGDATTKQYVDDAIDTLKGPGVSAAFDTLKEIEDIVGSGTVTGDLITMIGTKLPKAGGAMAGNITMGSNEVTGLPNPPTSGTHATSKDYVDGILGSATAAATSATNALASENAASGHVATALSHSYNAQISAAAAEAALDNFDDRYLGAKSSAPTLDNDGNALITGALYFNSTTNKMNMYTGSAWSVIGDVANRTRTTHTAGSTGSNTFNVTYDQTQPETLDVYLNGVKLVVGTDVTATNGTTITLTATTGDTVETLVMSPFNQANVGSASTKNVGIGNDQVPTFTTGVADDDFLRINGTNVEGLSATETFTAISSGHTGALSHLPDTNYQFKSFKSNQFTATKNNHTIGNPKIIIENPSFMDHGMSTIADVDLVGDFSEVNASTQLGGLKIRGFGMKPPNSGTQTGSLSLEGYAHTPNTSTSDDAIIQMLTKKKSGTSATSSLAANEFAINIDNSIHIMGDRSVNIKGSLREEHTTGSLTNSNQTLTLDFSTGNNFEVTLAADITAIVINNMPTTGIAYAFTLKVVQDATQDRTIAWNAVTDGSGTTYNIRWHGGTLPTLSTGGSKTDVFCFFTTDQGSNIYGFTAGQNMS